MAGRGRPPKRILPHVPDIQGAAFVGYGHVVTDAQRAEWQAWADGRAQDAFAQGRAAQARGELDQAEFWFSRARRMARDNPNVAFALASVFLAQGAWARAQGLMADLWAQFRLREAGCGLCLALLRQGDVDAACAMLDDVLRRCGLNADLAVVARLVAEEIGRGWCGFSGEGLLTLGGSGAFLVVLDNGPTQVARAGTLRIPPAVIAIRVLHEGIPALGSGLDRRVIGRIEGFVQASARGIEGWVWHPAEPERIPALIVEGEDGTRQRLAPRRFAQDVSNDVPLARPRRLDLRRATLPPGRLSITDGHGRMLTGAPLDPALAGLVVPEAGLPIPERFAPVPVASVPKRARKLAPRARGVMIVVPVYADAAATKACFASLFATVPRGVEIVVVDDAAPDPDLRTWLADQAREGTITLVRHDRNRGFPASVNAGMARAKGRDVVLLNSDTLLPPGWLAVLGAAARAAGDTGTATPLSNRASILSYPDVKGDNAAPDRTGVALLADDTHAVNGDITAEIPTANGFCMYIRADCLAETGPFREDVFAQGYGEENDFCMRARALGFRHVAALGTYVGHVGSASFGATRGPLMARNGAIVEALHPGYDALVQDHIRSDPLHAARRRLDMRRLLRGRGGRRALVLVLHEGGGGVARVVRERAALAAQSGYWPLLLRPHEVGCVVQPADPAEGAFPNLRFALPQDEGMLRDLLRDAGIVAFEWHHLVGHAPQVRTLPRDLGVPYDIFIHDYVWFCQRISLIGPTGRYCGEPAIAGCERCVATLGSHLGERIGMQALVARSQAELDGARRLMAPSHDAARRIMRHFGKRAIDVLPLEDDKTLPAPHLTGEAVRRVCILGGIGREKGFDVVLALAEDARARDLPIAYSLIGHTPDDEALIATGKVRVTGAFREGEAAALIAAEGAQIGFIPSITPETWCFALGQLWQAGLGVVAFDIGAQGERLARRGPLAGASVRVPLGLPPQALNDLFLGLRA